MFDDLRFSARLLRKQALSVSCGAAVMACGVGLTASIGAVIYTAGIQAPPIASPSEVFALYAVNRTSGRDREPVSGDTVRRWSDQMRSRMTIASSVPQAIDLMLDGVPHPSRVELVSTTFFDVFRPRFVAGTAIANGTAGAAQCVVSETFWRQNLLPAGISIGDSISVDGISFAVAGVVDDAFARWRGGLEVWIPFSALPDRVPVAALTTDGYPIFHVAGRATAAANGLTRERLETIANQLPPADPSQSRPTFRVVSAADLYRDGSINTVLRLLTTAVLLVMLVVAASSFGLSLARAVGRTAEFQIRRSLGASRTVLVRLLACDAALVAACAAPFAVLACWWSLPLLLSLAPPDVALRATLPSHGVLATMVVALVFTLSALVAIPVCAIVTSDCLTARVETSGYRSLPAVVGSLKAGVVVNTAAAFMLIASAVILIQTGFHLNAIDLGFQPRDLLVTTLNPASALTGLRAGELSTYYADVVDRVRSVPGVADAAVGSTPVDYLRDDLAAPGVSISIENGKRFLNGDPAGAAFAPGRRLVTPGYFSTLGLRLVTGRLFTAGDNAGTPPIAIVNETMARLHWPGQSAIGKRINFAAVRPNRPLVEPWIEVVGVVNDARLYRLEANPRPEVFVPLAQRPTTAPLTLIVRSAVGTDTLPPQIRAAVREVRSTVPIYDMRTMRSIVADATAVPRYARQLLIAVSALAIVIAAISIYGLCAFIAGRRARDIAIRLALGAGESTVLREVLAQIGWLTGAGLLIGGIGSVLTSGVLSRLVYGTTPQNPVALAVAALTVATVAIGASWQPFRRITRAEPMSVLRTD
jgi:predicted permease